MNRLLTALVFLTLAFAAPSATQAQQANTTTLSPEVEQIFIARSVRDSRVPPTEFCGKSNSGVSNASAEDRYTFRAVATRASDGRVMDAESTTVGTLHACFGTTANANTYEFYGDGTLDSVAFKGFGDCILTNYDFPEKGLQVSHCYLTLSGLPDQYIGGQLTTNTMGSRKPLGLETDPVGYRQQSIATIRLWKKRSEL